VGGAEVMVLVPQPNGHLMGTKVRPRPHFISRDFQILLMEAVIGFPLDVPILVPLLGNWPRGIWFNWFIRIPEMANEKLGH